MAYRPSCLACSAAPFPLRTRATLPVRARRAMVACAAAQPNNPAGASLDASLDLSAPMPTPDDAPTTTATTPFAAISAAYASSLATSPVRTKALTSLVGFMVGDLCAQLLTPGGFEFARVLRLGAYGFFLDGPVGHLFYKALDQYVAPERPTDPGTILAKTAIDQLVWAPTMTVVFFVFLRLLEGHPEAIVSTVHDRVLPTLLANYFIWPFAHYVSFRWIPTDYRILYNNVISVRGVLAPKRLFFDGDHKTDCMDHMAVHVCFGRHQH